MYRCSSKVIKRKCYVWLKSHPSLPHFPNTPNVHRNAWKIYSIKNFQKKICPTIIIKIIFTEYFSTMDHIFLIPYFPLCISLYSLSSLAPDALLNLNANVYFPAKNIAKYQEQNRRNKYLGICVRIVFPSIKNVALLFTGAPANEYDTDT